MSRPHFTHQDPPWETLKALAPLFLRSRRRKAAGLLS